MSWAENEYIAKRLEISGIVQGVGFRPFVFQLATRLNLKGEVANTSSGVSVVIEGRRESIDAFAKHLREDAPALAEITAIHASSLPVKGHTLFSIAQSRGHGQARSALISPDVSICDDCLNELFNPRDRRYRYPFINCTNCGPRYTIIEDIPYDRPFTSMRHFTMCASCQAEYDDPLSRRFHAQPNACPACGPSVALLNNQKKRLAPEQPIEKTIELLEAGYIIAIKGLGGFHLAVDACNRSAVARLRERKIREEKPFALMALDVEKVKRFADIGPDEEALISDKSRPIVLLEKKQPHRIAENVSPKNRYFGTMLPYTPLHYLMLKNNFAALVMTSGNISDEPIAVDNDEALGRLTSIADFFLIHNRDIYLRSDDSIACHEPGGARFIRRSRGFVPVPIFLKKAVPRVLACGGELKNTICLTKNNRAFLSQHVGDMENLETDRFFRRTVDHMKRILEIEPEIIAHDLHPDYLSTAYADEQTGIKKIGVQHHHAHIVSCMAENHSDGPVIGLSFDGTGYGDDGTVWGGEVLIAEIGRFERAAHLACMPMPGGAAAIREPWRMAVSFLFYAFGEECVSMNLPVTRATDKHKLMAVIDMIKKRINSPLTSSMGRLFDGIASMTGVRQCVNFEGQAAMEFEMLASGNRTEHYDYGTLPEEFSVVPVDPIIKGVTRDILKGIDPPVISARFHNTLVCLFTHVCETLRTKTGLNSVAMSGGVFQNRILLRGLGRSLEDKGFDVLTQKKVPANDGGLSLGQAVAAATMAGN